MDSLARALEGLTWSWLGSALGACAAWWPWQPRARSMALLLGVASGVMLGAAFMSLLPKAQDSAGPGGLWLVASGFVVGIAAIALLDRLLPHQHPGAPAPDHAPRPLAPAVGTGVLSTSTGVLIALALTIHNLPEGLAVGVAAAAEGTDAAARTVVVAIAGHNIIEGLLVAVPLRLAGYSSAKAFAYGQASGLAEVLAGLMGASLVGLVSAFLPWALAAAAGAMVFVVFEELLPEAVRAQAGNAGPWGATLGVVAVMLLSGLGA